MDDASLVVLGKTAWMASGRPLNPSSMALRVPSAPGLGSAFRHEAGFVGWHPSQPELGALVLLQPQSRDILGAVGPYAQGNVAGFVAHQAFVLQN